MIHAVMHARILWLIAGVVLAGWRIDVYFHPFARCRWCKGTGMNSGSRSTAYGLCTHGPRRVRAFASRAAARQQERGK